MSSISADRWTLIALTSSALAGLLALGLLILLARDRQRRRLARPDWERMLADADYYRQALARVLRARGFQVTQCWMIPDPIDHQVHEVLFALNKRGQLYAGLCGRWEIPITSEIITHFHAALATTRAQRGMIITTSWFSDAARESSRGLPVDLVDGTELFSWIDQIWA